MNIQTLLSYYKDHPIIQQLDEKWDHSNYFFLKGISGSAASLVVASLFQIRKDVHVVVLNDKEEAAYFYNDLTQLLGNEAVLFFPASYKRSIQYHQQDPANIILRTGVMEKIGEAPEPLIVVTYPEALIERVVSQNNLLSQTLTIKKGEELGIEFIQEVLESYDFERVDFVYEPGQYSIRGSIVDIFSFSYEYPYRIDFFGDEVETIRTFNIETQLSILHQDSVAIISNLSQQTEQVISFPKFLPSTTKWWLKDIKFVNDKIAQIHQNTLKKESSEELEETQAISVEKQMVSAEEFNSNLREFKLLEFGAYASQENPSLISFSISSQPRFNKNFELVIEDLHKKEEQGYQNYILSDNEKQIERLQAIFEDKDESLSFSPILRTLHEGFQDHDLQITAYTDHQIFDRYHKFRLRSDRPKSGKMTLTLKELNQLHPGDFVVHQDHGIGRFGGLIKTELNGKPQEVIKLTYKDDDVLFVSIHSLHRISKFKSKDGTPPRINKLGTGAWQKLKDRTKKKVKDIAKELIALYAQRKAEQSFGFSPDSFLQQELEASFIYEDTPDQFKSTKAVKEDMEKPIPMDRLVCGDVGFGKTEIAIRAAFKAACDNKQVAVLVPTTILALQHFKTFSERLKDFPVRVEYVSRLRRTSSVRKALKDLEAGQVDIIIGTHRLIGKDVQFKNLGLLIIDEEQKFGVSTKEKLKQLKVNVDTLTMTATPIPRTLQFSLMGARDLSIINTPPPNRYPILTELHTFNEEILREAISYEIERNGQVFFIHNRIQNIFEIEALIKRLLPKVRTIVGHGQMEGPKLEKIMLDFISGDYDVLIATTIIESGLDIPNANTIIINNAQNFGLSELHQLRGRVGRSNKKAFCFLFAPPLVSMSNDAQRRLNAIESFSELGSGFNIAMQDLDIRGAGNLLGGEQSGFIADIGLETYQRILTEAMQELKEEEYKDLFKEEREAQDHAFLTECQVESDLELLLPDSYIQNVAERISTYRELDNMSDEAALREFEDRLTDRFGPIPEQAQQLIEVVRLRWMAIDLGIEKIILKSGKLLAYFISNPGSLFFQSPSFMGILQFIQNHPKACRMKENRNRLSLIFENVKTINQGLEVIRPIHQSIRSSAGDK